MTNFTTIYTKPCDRFTFSHYKMATGCAKDNADSVLLMAEEVRNFLVNHNQKPTSFWSQRKSKAEDAPGQAAKEEVGLDMELSATTDSIPLDEDFLGGDIPEDDTEFNSSTVTLGTLLSQKESSSKYRGVHKNHTRVLVKILNFPEGQPERLRLHERHLEQMLNAIGHHPNFIQVRTSQLIRSTTTQKSWATLCGSTRKCSANLLNESSYKVVGRSWKRPAITFAKS